MNEPPRTLQIIASQPAGFCDPESGVCHVPDDEQADSATETGGPSATPTHGDV